MIDKNIIKKVNEIFESSIYKNLVDNREIKLVKKSIQLGYEQGLLTFVKLLKRFNII